MLYTYNHLGQRISKTGPDGTTQYVYDGDKLLTEVAPSYKLDFLYDENGQLFGFIKDNATKYFYICDVLGNILGIVDESINLVAKYTYTAFGKVTISLDTNSVASINPFRYKGYYYDTESQMYYCNARYYVPAWGRWLTPDTPDYLQYDSITGFNTFAYCNNNPVMYADPSGHIAITAAATLTAIAKGIFALLVLTGITAVESETGIIEKTIGKIGAGIDRWWNNLEDKFEEFKKKATLVIGNFVARLVLSQQSGKQKHHIVAQRAWRAAPARFILQCYGININDPINTVYVSNRYHRVMHTKTYYLIVNVSVGIGSLVGGKEGVEAVLLMFQEILGKY